MCFEKSDNNKNSSKNFKAIEMIWIPKEETIEDYEKENQRLEEDGNYYARRVGFYLLDTEGKKRFDFLSPTSCQPNSPDLNPVDYCIWGMLEQNVYRGWKITDTGVLMSSTGYGPRQRT